MCIQDSRFVTYLRSMSSRHHSPSFIISCIRRGTVSIFISATYVYDMYPFRYFPTSHQSKVPRTYDFLLFLFSLYN